MEYKMNYISETIKRLRNEDIVPVLENAIKSKELKTWSPTLIVAAEEITQLRRQVLALGGTLPPKTDTLTGEQEQPMTITLSEWEYKQ